MKCIFVVPRMGGGGAERVVSLLANALVNKGNDVTVYTLVGGESFYALDRKISYESIGVSVDRKNALTAILSKLKFFPKSYFALRKKLKSKKYDIVVSMLPECDILVGLCKLFGLKFKHICSERNDPNSRGKLYMSVLKFIYKKADVFVCQGKRVYDYYKNVPEKTKKIISNPVDGDKLPLRAEIITKRIVSVGRLDSQKNFPLLIKSFAALGEQFSEYRLDIYGEGPERETLQKLIESFNLQERISLCGAKKNVQQLISDAEIFVMSSDYEGFPNALLEAMSIGLPVISTDFPTGIAAELIGKENGILVPVGDKDEMTAAIIELLSDKERRAQMGANNREMCKKFYIPNIIAEWETALENI